ATFPTTCRTSRGTSPPSAGSKRKSARSSTRSARGTRKPRRSKRSLHCNIDGAASAKIDDDIQSLRMLDPNLFRNDLPGVTAALAKRGVTLDAERFAALELERKNLQMRTQELQAKRNSLSKEIGAAKGKGLDVSAPMADV